MTTKRILMPLVLIGTALVLAALVEVESNSKAAAGDSQHLEGSWIVRATVTGDPTVLGALITFSPNGEVVETPSTGVGQHWSRGLGQNQASRVLNNSPVHPARRQWAIHRNVESALDL